MRALARVWAVVALVGVVHTTAMAQRGVYVPLGDPAYAYIDALMVRGTLRSLTALERPYLVQDVRAALAASDTSRVDHGLVARLGRALGRYDRSTLGGDTSQTRLGVAADDGANAARRRRPAGLTASGMVGIGAVGETSGRRELMLAEGDRHLAPETDAWMGLSAGPLAIVARPAFDPAARFDPDLNRKRTLSRVRLDEGYAILTEPYAILSIGSVSRNWGPPAEEGLQVGNAPVAYPHLYARLGPSRLHLTSLLARLDDSIDAGDRSVVWRRYFSVHRLAVMTDEFELAFGEAIVYSGAKRSWEPGFTNPLNLYLLSYHTEKLEGNFNLNLEGGWRPAWGGRYLAQVMIDDYQIDRRSLADQKPASYGVTVTADGLPFPNRALPPGADPRSFLSYTRVSNLTYNNTTASDKYLIDGMSLARAFSDYDELRGGVDLLLAHAPVRLYAALRRQGEGDYRLPHPDSTQYPFVRGFLSGTTTRIRRVGVTGTWDEERFGVLGITTDLGYNWVRQPRPVTVTAIGALAPSGFQGRVTLRVGLAVRETRQ